MNVRFGTLIIFLVIIAARSVYALPALTSGANHCSDLKVNDCSDLLFIQQTDVPNRWQSPSNSLEQFPRLGGEDCARYGRAYGYPECNRPGKPPAAQPASPPAQPTNPPQEAAVPAAPPPSAKAPEVSPPSTPLPLRKPAALAAPLSQANAAASPWAASEAQAEPEPSPQPAALAPADALFAARAGKLLITVFDGSSPSETAIQSLAERVRSGALGGVLIRADNASDPRQLKALTAALVVNQSRPPLIIADSAGGDAGTLRRERGFLTFASPRETGVRGDALAAFNDYRSMAAQLTGLGVTMAFGPDAKPCAALAENKRCFSGTQKHAASFVTAFIFALHEQATLAALRYPQGEGGAETLQEMISRQAPDAVVIVPPDDRALAGTLADTAASLRKAGFQGMLMLDMTNDRLAGNPSQRFVTAVKDGADMVLLRAGDADFGAALRNALASGELSYARLEEAESRAEAVRERLAEWRARLAANDGQAGLPDESQGTR